MKQGYLIAKNTLVKEFFTSSSAYDRPVWKPLAEATVYATAELADAAAKKLYRNGEYSAKIVSLQEMNLSFEPIDREEPAEEELPPVSDEMGDEGSGEPGDEMVADEQTDVCPECEHEPCTCEDCDDNEDLNDDMDSEFGDEDLSDDELADVESDIDLGLDPDEDLNMGPDEDEIETDPSFDNRRMGMAQMSPMGAPRKIGAMESAIMPSKPAADAQPTPTNTPAQKVDTLKFKDPASTGKDDVQSSNPHEKKVSVPSNVVSELKAKIAEYDREAENFKNSDDARASFAMTAADAMKTLLDLLQAGTVADIKKASVHLTSLMSPITNNIPASVIKFVSYQGEKPSLKDLFNAKREERK